MLSAFIAFLKEKKSRLQYLQGKETNWEILGVEYQIIVNIGQIFFLALNLNLFDNQVSSQWDVYGICQNLLIYLQNNFLITKEGKWFYPSTAHQKE